MDSQRPTPSSFSPARRFSIGVNVGVSILVLLVLLAMLNYLAERHFRRYLWTGDQRFQLSPITLRVLKSVTNDIHVTVLFDRGDPLFSAVTGLLKEYQYACPRITVELVDYKKDVSRAAYIISKYQLPQKEDDLVVFDEAGHVKVVRESELSDYNVAAILQGAREVKRIAFKGEPLFTSAIAALNEGRSAKVYFLAGDGEHNPKSEESLYGYSKFARLLRQKNLTVGTLRLVGTNTVPDDCQLLIVAGPQNPLSQQELDRINDYLNQGGRLLALLSFYRSHFRETGMERLLANWGVRVGDNVVSDNPMTMTGKDIVCTNFSDQPIVRPLQQEQLYLLLPRSVDPLPQAGADSPRATTLFATSTAGDVTTQLSQDGVPRPNPYRDRRGAIPLAVAVEKGSLQGVGADRSSTRIVVVGDSIFLGNKTIDKFANLDFASLAVSWLLDRSHAIAGLTPRPIVEYNILLTRSQMTQARWLLLFVLPIAPLGIGLMVWFRRRR